MKIPDLLSHVKENFWQFLMVTAELQLQPMLIVIRMGIAHSEVYWLHQMDQKVCSISIKRTKWKLLRFIIEWQQNIWKFATQNIASLLWLPLCEWQSIWAYLWFCLQYMQQQEQDCTLSTTWLQWAKMLVVNWRQRLALASLIACNVKNETRCAIWICHSFG